MVGNFKAIYSTRWKDLGEGFSMLDEAWRNHLFKSFSRVPSQQALLRPFVAAYGHSTDLQFDCLMSPENQKELLEAASRIT
jgi:hypothetical protein